MMYSNVFNIIQIQGNFSYVSTHLELVWCFCLFRSVYPWAEAMLDDVGQRPSSSGPFDPPFHVVEYDPVQGSAVIDGWWSRALAGAMKLNQCPVIKSCN